MSRRIRVPQAGLCVLGLLVASGLSVVQAQSAAGIANSDGNAGGLRYIEEGMPPVMIHPTVEAAKQAREAAKPSRPRGGSNNLSYHGGVGGIGVETAPKIYLVFWGSQWNGNDPSGEAATLEGFYGAAG